LARRKARDVDVVVTNHALLAGDATLDIHVRPAPAVQNPAARPLWGGFRC